MPVPNRSMSLVTALLVVVLSVVAVSPAWAQEPESESAAAPDFTIDTIDGDTFQLSEHRGDVVVLNFWATWCPPCRREIPDLVDLQHSLGDRGLQIVGVALERDAGVEAVRTFADEMNVNYPVGLGDGSIVEDFGGIPGLPTTFVIGPDGNIQGQISGMTTKEELRPGLEKLLEDAS